jgi:hypothetical protein
VKFVFRWRAWGQERESIVEAPNYPEACFGLGVHHARVMAELGASEWPPDLEIDLSKTERFGVCRKCGCTDDDCSQCITRTGEACSWTDGTHTLCTACLTPSSRSRTAAADLRGSSRQ